MIEGDLREAPLVRRNSRVERALYGYDFLCSVIKAVPVSYKLDHLLLSYLRLAKMGFSGFEG